MRSGGIRSSASIRIATGARTSAMHALSPATMPRFWSNRMTCGRVNVAFTRAAKEGVAVVRQHHVEVLQVCAFKSPNIFSKLASSR